jgi:ribosomal protein S12 methylthiotransferase
MAKTYWVETLGCPKNHVDSDKVTGQLLRDGFIAAPSPDGADLVVVNTCAFIDEARRESIDVILDLAGRKGETSRLVVTGCMAERYGEEITDALPEVDLVAGFGESLTASVPVSLGKKSHAVRTSELLELPRTPTSTPWAYLKVAEGCDRICGFCAIPSFRGPQRSRTVESLVREVETLKNGAEVPLREVVLIAQDLASFGRDRSGGRNGDPDDFSRAAKAGEQPILEALEALRGAVDWIRLLYLYPSGLTPALIEKMVESGVPYFDLSLQHVTRPMLKQMRRFGDGDKFLERISAIRDLAPEAAFRSSFIVGYPGETEADHDALLSFISEAQLDWAGFFPYSAEEGTYAAGLADQVPKKLVDERLREVRELQDEITFARRDDLIGETMTVLVDKPGQARSTREAPEIDGVIVVPTSLKAGTMVDVEIVAAMGTDLEGVAVGGTER